MADGSDDDFTDLHESILTTTLEFEDTCQYYYVLVRLGVLGFLVVLRTQECCC